MPWSPGLLNSPFQCETQEKMASVLGRELGVQNIPTHLLPRSPPLAGPMERNEAESIHLTSGPVSFLPSASHTVCLREGWELCNQEPTEESACYFCRDVCKRRDRKPGGEAPPHPRPGPAPNVTIWGWGHHPLPLREDVKVKMPKSKGKVERNQAGEQSVTELLVV